MKPLITEKSELTLDGDDGTAVVQLSPPSTSVFVDGNGVLCGTVSIAITGASNSEKGATGGTGAGTIDGTAEHILVDGQKPLLEGDSATITVTGVDAKSNPISWDITATFKDAGQKDVSGD